MVCRDEHLTETNNVAREAMLREVRLERIAQIWHDRCMIKHHEWISEYNRRIEEVYARQEADEQFLEKFQTWWAELVQVNYELKTLMENFRDYEPVTPADWDAVSKGKERKVLAIFRPLHPKEQWPRQVPYLKLIALALYDEEEELRRTACMKQYYMAVRGLNQQGKETLMQEQDKSDTLPGLSGNRSITKEQIQQYPEKLHADKQQPEAGKEQVHGDFFQILLHRLHEQPILSKDWDVKVWAGTTMEELGLVATPEAEDRVIQSIENVVQQWRLDEEPVVEPDGEYELAFEQDVDEKDGYFLPYDV